MISYCGGEGIREEDIDISLGLVGREAVRAGAAAILAHDPAAAIEAVGTLVDKGHDLRRFSAELLGYFRDIMVAGVSKKPERTLDLSEQEIASLKETAASVNNEEVIRVMNVLVKLQDEMKFSMMQRTTLELALVKAASRPVHTVDDILKGLAAGGGYAAPAPARPAAPAGGFGVGKSKFTAPAPKPAAASKPAADGKDGEEGPRFTPVLPQRSASQEAADAWEAARNEIKKLGKPPLASKMMAASPGSIDGGALVVAEGSIPFKPEELALVAEAAKKTSGLEIKIVKGGEKGRTLADVRKEKDESRRDEIKAEAVRDPFIKSALDLFGGEAIEVEEDTANHGVPEPQG